MLIESQPARHLRARLISDLHARTALTALAIVRLSASPKKGITVHSASSGSTSIPSTHHNQAEAVL